MNFAPFNGPFSSASQFVSKDEITSSSPSTTFSAAPGIESPADDANRYESHFGNHQPISVPITKYQTSQQTLPVVNNNHFSQQAPFNQHIQQHQDPSAEVQQSALSESRRTYPSEEVPQLQQNNKEPKEDHGYQQQQQMGHSQQASMPPTWQSLATPGSTVADYLSHLPASTLPISLHHFLKYSAESIKKETESTVTLPPNQQITQVITKKKKKKRAPKEKKQKPKPGEIRLTTALDGTTLFCCPECHLAYREKELLEQHLVSHKLERRFICDICGAGLKRKDHLTRHKQSHNPERPFVCTICNKAFKRKEQLTLHFVIHSGEKRHICPECNKGFYRKDHLRKHTRSHITRRVKAEMSNQGGQGTLHQQAAPLLS